jgi:hypothetical protein
MENAMAQLMRRHHESLSRLRDEVATMRRTLAAMQAQAQAFRESARRMRSKI